VSNSNRSSELVTNAVTALSIGAMEIAMAVSLAAFVFAGDLSDGLSRAAISYMVGSGIVLAAVGSFSTFRVAIGSAQDTAAVVAAAIGASLAADVAADQRVQTAMVALALGGLLTAILFMAVGQARLAEVARSIPFTVISGFMAGTGWLLVWGGIAVMTGTSATVWEVGDLLSSEMVRLWLPGLALAVIVLIAIQRQMSSIVVGGAMVGGTLAVHLIGRLGWSLDTLEANGWLLGPFPESGTFSPILPSDIAAADWGAIAAHSFPLAGLAAVSLVGALLNLTGLEVACEDDIDLNRELTTVGAANVFTAAAGGLVGYHIMSYTLLVERLRARGRTVPLMIVGLMIAVILLGGGVIGLMPRAVAGSVLCASGASLLIGWARQLLSSFGRLDRILSLLVLTAIVLFGVLTGIGAGLVAAIVVFVYTYGRMSPIRGTHRLSTVESNIDRPATHRAVLLDNDDSVAILELHGYLFFGSIRTIGDAITSLLENRLRFLVLDFRSVRGIDASVVAGLLAIERKARHEGVMIVWAHLRPEIAGALAESGADERRVEADLDHALEWVEDQVLEGHGAVGAPVDMAWLSEITPYGQRIELKAGETLIELADSTRRIFAIESGTLTAWGESVAGEPIRYRRVGAGSFLGEIAFTTGAPRSATVVADGKAVVVAIAPEAIAEMAKVNPALAIKTNHIVATRLAERLAATSRTVRNLSS
jgi:SulP family sulfate permease